MAKRAEKHSILVPVDFSTHSEAALICATELAAALKAPLNVLHVVHDPGEAPGYYQVKGRKKQLTKLEDVAREMLETFMQEMMKRHPDEATLRHAKQTLVTGLPVSRVLEIVEKTKPRMVVMGSAGRTGLSRFLLGSKAEQLVRLCPVPITIVKVPEDEE